MTLNQCDALDGSGREKRWLPAHITLVLRCIEHCPGEQYDDPSSELVKELKRVLPGENWGHRDTNGQPRDPFRETKSMFEFTGTASFNEEEKTAEVTELGRRFLARKIHFDQLLIDGIKRYERTAGNPKIFSTIISALAQGDSMSADEMLQLEVAE
jgi:hypothetical protein